VNPVAGEPAARPESVNVPRLVTAYYADRPDPSVATQRVAFSTSGHHGSALNRSFNEAHALSISQAICDYRKRQGIHGPVFLGIDANAVSMLAFATSLEVLAANDVEVLVASNDESIPARAVSDAILTYNRGRADALADGIVLAPSLGRPEDGGFEYTLPHGGSPDVHATRWINTAANEYLRWGSSSVRRLPYEQALAAPTTHGAGLLPPSLYFRAAPPEISAKIPRHGSSAPVPQGSRSHRRRSYRGAHEAAGGRDVGAAGGAVTGD
jgi:phosphoglucomutase